MQRRAAKASSTSGMLLWVVIGFLTLGIMYQNYSCRLGVRGGNAGGASAEGKGARGDPPSVGQNSIPVTPQQQQPLLRAGNDGNSALTVREHRLQALFSKLSVVRRAKLIQHAQKHPEWDDEEVDGVAAARKSTTAELVAGAKTQKEDQVPTNRDLDALADAGGEYFKNEQAKNELARVERMVQEQQEMMQRQRIDERRFENQRRQASMRITNAKSSSGRSSATQRGGASETKNFIHCRCSGLSSMDPRSNWCNSYNGHSGAKVSPAHVCVVEDVCLSSSGKMHFKSQVTEEEATRSQIDFSIPLANGVNLPSSIVFKPSSGNSSKKENVDRWQEMSNSQAYAEGLSFEPSGSQAPYGTLVVLGQSAAVHITHFLEPIGSLQVGVRDMMVKSHSDKCDASDLSCFYRPSLVTSNAVNLQDEKLWGQHVLRVVFGDYDRKMSFDKLSAAAGKKASTPYKCFKKAVIPGAFYGIWPEGADTAQFHSDLKLYLESLKAVGGGAPVVGGGLEGKELEEHLRAREQKKNPTNTDKKAGVSSSMHPNRKILIAHRTSKRTIVDFENFFRIVENEAAKYGATVGKVMFGQKKFLDQATLAEEAGVLMGIHGADLTNMIFQHPKSVVVEINPLFFFENRFYELAHALGHKYMPWNCGTHECAFGGDTNKFKRYLSHHHLDYNFTDYTITTKEYGSFQWGWKGYVGYGCLACNHVTCCTGVQNGFYSELRESDVRIGTGRHEAEIRSVLRDAFTHLQWTKRAT